MSLPARRAAPSGAHLRTQPPRRLAPPPCLRPSRHNPLLPHKVRKHFWAGSPKLRQIVAMAEPSSAAAVGEGVPYESLPSDGEPDLEAGAVRPGWLAAARALCGENWKMLVVAVVGLALWWVPAPAGVQPRGMHLLAIFVATICGIILQPIPLGAVAMVGLAATLLTYTLSFAEAFASFSAEVPWLIAIAMFLAQAIRKTGLGKRLSYLFISFFGSSTLGMTYSLVFSEFLLSPMIPSVAARSGGIVLPLVRSMSEACGSQPNDGTARKLGAYLMATCFHTSAVSSAMFLTANHPNPLSAQLAAATIDKPISWVLWAKAAIVPGLASLIVVPLFLKAVYPPNMRDTKLAQAVARSDLKALGKPQYGEGMTLFAMAVTIALWIGAEHFHYGVVTAALAGLSILLVSKVITWEECLGYQSAWNTMTWFAVLIAMATQLKKLGVIGVFSSEVATAVSTLGWGWQPSFVILVLVYFYSHYFFASNIAHVSAMYSAFLAVAIATGAPPMFAALVFAFFSNIQGTLTQYGMSHAPMYFGQDYVPLERWLLLGFLVSVVNITVWLTVGGFWWKFLGLW